MSDPVVILGSGLAAYTVAREFRRLDKTTPLVVVSRDHAGFYSKPMLSNALAGNKTAATLVMKAADKMAAELAGEVRAGIVVEAIDTAAQQVLLAGGERLAYRDLVLALGADPIRLDLQGDAAQAVVSVNDLDDYARFASLLADAKAVSILGAGLIGCEFANDLLARGITPTVVDLADRPLPRLLPPEASAFLRQRLEAAGVHFRLGTGASRLDRRVDSVGEDSSRQGELQLSLDDGELVSTDLVLSAVGLVPRTTIAQAAGLKVGRGVVVDRLLASSAPHVWAVGDNAEVAGHNLPYVMPLMQQGRALAATLAGTPTPVSYPAMPVTVKTPACPTVVCPPPPGTAGEWQISPEEGGLECRFTGPQGQLLGFALLGTATARKQALAAQVPGWIAA